MCRAIAVLPLLAGCGLGLGDGAGGGDDNLPTLGAGPYGRLDADFETPADEPFLVTSRAADYRDPAALARPDGGLRIWFAARADADPLDAAHLAYAEVAGLHELPELGPTDVLRPVLPWEQDHIGAPSITREATRDGEHLVLYYAAGVADPAIGRAVSTDDGATWVRDDQPVLTGAADPAAVLVDGTWHLFVTRPGTPGIWRARSGDGIAFELDAAPIVTARPDLAEAFDARGVAAPFAAIDVSDAGRQHWGLWFAGEAAASPTAPDAGPEGAETSIGYAGSFDGNRWERFGGAAPVLAAPAGGPCVLVDGPRGVMLYHQEQRLHLGIGVAVHP